MLQDISALTLDQILLFVTVAEAGSFSAAARQLDRAQSTVSYGVSQLESQLGLSLFEREHRKPVLSAEGRALFIEARGILQSVREWKGHAERLHGGEETEVSLVLDRIVPVQLLTESIQYLKPDYPQVKWTVYSEVLGAISARVVAGEAQLALTGYLLPEHRSELHAEQLGSLGFVIVASPDHPLATQSALTLDILENYTQMVVEDRGAGSDSRVSSRSVWQLSGLWEIREFALAGLGWAYLPVHMVQNDLKKERLVALSLEQTASRSRGVNLYGIYRRDRPPGPVGQALLAQWRERVRRYQSQWSR